MLTPKQEKFCHKYIETGNASEAYRQAYNAGAMKPGTINSKACLLIAEGNITARLNELREAATKRHAVTVASLMIELEEARQVAKTGNMASAMVAATMGKGKLLGLDKDGDGDEAQPVNVNVTVTDARKPHADP